jgi:8-amino-7-oxononanoate synthase
MPSSNFLKSKLEERKGKNAFRSLRKNIEGADFSSNDYLGVVTNNLLVVKRPSERHGSTGSRLLTGNAAFTEETESFIAGFHNAPSALIFNSGYDANIGLLSCIASKGDTILYDALSHASIRDGIRLGNATAHAFRHNDVSDLQQKLPIATGNIFVVTESIFSMDGDFAPLNEIAQLCREKNAMLIVDEAHATGVAGNKGEGIVQAMGLESECFARVHTFGKALGCHGAVVLGTSDLRDYLINFSRPFLYTTALPEMAIAACRKAYELLPALDEERKELKTLIQFWNSHTYTNCSRNDSAIQYILVPGNAAVKQLSNEFLLQGIDARPILYPSVPEGKERIRIVLHSFNSEIEIKKIFLLLGARFKVPG